MTETFACPACGETERLAGRRDGHDVLIRCEACGQEWRRDLDVCPSCGSRTIADRREPLMQKARGTQQSIIGYRIVKECWTCGYVGT